MEITDYTYDLPEELIATEPPEQRGTTRLLVLERNKGTISHRLYGDLADYAQAGDVVVLNDTRVIRSRLIATTDSGKIRELLLLERHGHESPDPHRWRALYRGKIRAGDSLLVNNSTVKVESIEEGGIATITSEASLVELSETVGSVPLPPYMHRNATDNDIKRYQTVFARTPGSVAAPTASLNFTEELTKKLQAKGVIVAYLTLHVGLGTFLPIRTEKIEDHVMHSEYFEIPAETVQVIRSAKKVGRKIFAVGTTVCRTLEFASSSLLSEDDWYDTASSSHGLSGEAQIFIYPGYTFRVVDALLTNFHAPKSTVLMMAAAFAGWPELKNAYQKAIEKKYALLSYGDSMLII